MKLSKPLIAAVAAGTLALGGLGAWLALPGSTSSAAPTVQLNATNAGVDVAATPTTCDTQSWPASAQGQPAGDVVEGAKGFYLWHTDSSHWHLEVTHPTTDHVVFSGHFTSDGTLTFNRVDDERNDITGEGPHDHTMSFVFNNFGGLDGVHFETNCADWLEFHLFIDGTPAGVEQVNVGGASVHPLEMPFSVDRTGVH